MREGSLEAPTRHPLDWMSEKFYDEEDLLKNSKESMTFATGVGVA